MDELGHLHHFDQGVDEFELDVRYAWTAPRTWVTSELVTSSMMNTHVRDNLIATSHVLDYSTADSTVNNNAAETSLYSYSVPGGTIETNRTLKLRVIMDVLQNSGADRTIVWKVKYGATTVLTFTTDGSVSVSATRREARLEVDLCGDGATNAQLAQGMMMLSRPGEDLTGTDWRALAESYLSWRSGTATEDSTAAKTLDVTVTLGAANASYECRKRYARVMIE